MPVNRQRPTLWSPAERQEAPEDTGQRVGTFPRRGAGTRPDSELRVSLDWFNGSAYVNLRVWELGRDGKSWWPTKKGVSIRTSEAEDVSDAIVKAFDEAGSASPVGRRDQEESEPVPWDRPGSTDSAPGPERHADRSTPPWETPGVLG